MSTSSSGTVCSEGVSCPSGHLAHHGTRHKSVDSRSTASQQQQQRSYCPSQEWLYKLVTFPDYFTPCRHCCSGSRTPKREQLMTHFDTHSPYRVYCSHCPEYAVRGGVSLLQVRRSSFKNVVNANDILRFGADTTGVQHYTLNSNKVIYLSREATSDKKANSAAVPPSMCVVDGRAMMDKSSQYCSLKCKLQAEDAGFTYWLNCQDPSVRIAAEVAANAPPRPTVACKRSAGPSSCDSTPTAAEAEQHQAAAGGCCGGGNAGRQAKKLACIRISTGISAGSSCASSRAAAGHHSGEPAAAAAAAAAAHNLQRAASAPMPTFGNASHSPSASAGSPAAGCVSGTPAGLRPIRTSLCPPAAVLGGGRQHTAPPGSLDATADNLFGGSLHFGEPDLGDTLRGSSCTGSWVPGLIPDSELSSQPPWADDWEAAGLGLTANALDDAVFGDGSLSPALISAPDGSFSSMGSSRDWWLSSSPTAGMFATAGGF